jgi:hypothetical protein
MKLSVPVANVPSASQMSGANWRTPDAVGALAAATDSDVTDAEAADGDAIEGGTGAVMLVSPDLR